MTILRSLPARNLIDVHDEVNRLFDGMLGPGARPVDAIQPMAVDVHGTEAGFTLQFDLPGIRPEDVKVRIHDGVLTLFVPRAEAAKPREIKIDVVK